MSKIGKQPVLILQGVTVAVDGQKIKISGPKGRGAITIPNKIKVVVEDNQVLVSRDSEDKKTKSNHGTTRNIINNLVNGVVKEWTKELEVVGTGFQVLLAGQNLDFKLGFSHPVVFDQVDGARFEVDNNKIKVSGVNKELVGNVAAKIRSIKKPDAYKGKGIRYVGEVIKLKPGKAAKVGAGEE